LRAQDIEGGGNFEAVHANISRRLERQRDEAREHAANAEASLKMAINSANARQAEAEHAMRQRDELMEMLESFLGRARMGEVNKGMFVRIEELEGLSAAIAAAKGGNG
jgi:sugar-specific transcriptional regulator TrmB